MKTSNRTVGSNHKIVSALKALKERYSFTEFRRWNGHLITAEFKIGAAFPHALEKLGVIETKFGEVKLTERINSVRPSTIRKQINEYVTSHSVKKVKQPKIKLVQTKTESSFNEIIIALKEQIRKDVMSELLASLK